MAWFETRLPTLAWGCAGALGLVALAAWLVPPAIVESGLLLIGRRPIAELFPMLYLNRVALLLVALAACTVAAAGHWFAWSPGIVGSLGLGLCVGAELVTLAAIAPVAVVVVGLLLLNAAAWLGGIVLAFYLVIRLL